MDLEDKREIVRAAYVAALTQTDHERVAADLGIDAARLRQFKANGSLGKQTLLSVESWLRAHGYLADPGPDPPAVTPRQRDLFELLAAELRTLADRLTSPLPAELRRQAFIDAIRNYEAQLDVYEEVLTKQVEQSGK